MPESNQRRKEATEEEEGLKNARTAEALPKLDFEVQEGSDSERETCADSNDSVC